jgi:hypothetical protein
MRGTLREHPPFGGPGGSTGIRSSGDRAADPVRRAGDDARGMAVIEVHELHNREAARHLFVSEATVKTHLLHVYAKLGVNDRAAAVAEAFQRGLLTPDRR